MTDINHSSATRKVACDAAIGQLDAAAGTLRVYSGARPDPDSAAPASPLIQWTLQAPAFPASTDDGTNSSSALNGTPISGTAGNTGTATYMAVVNNAGTILWTGSVGTLSSGADLELTSLSISAGQDINLNSYTYRAPQQ